ncbi:hypothetical protein [Legionella sp.]|uniref:hypothetical protein n=1 Tax=Legionella sp. TaxID=459 RepID=UPI003C81CCE9
MLVEDVIKFCHSLLEEKKLNEFDTGLLKAINTRFARTESNVNLVEEFKFCDNIAEESKVSKFATDFLKSIAVKHSEPVLTKDDLHFLRNCYQERWHKIGSQEGDLNDTTVKKKWDALAIKIAEELDITYINLLMNESNEAEIAEYQHCCRLLVLLFATKFEGNSLITMWDRQNYIPKELSPVYQQLLPLFNLERTNFSELYTTILNNLIIPKSNEYGFFTNGKIHQWLQKVAKGQVAELGGYWFRPDLILFALMAAYDTTQVESQKSIIDGFLDELIRTYAQEKDPFSKELRVNILFSQFLSENTVQNTDIMKHLTSCDPEKARLNFVKNCTSYIERRFKSLQYTPPPSTMRCFLMEVPEKEYSVRGVVKYYSQVNMTHLDEAIKYNINSYILKKLTWSIPVADQVAENFSENQYSRDPIGWYS